MIGAIGTTTDLTQLKQMQETLMKAERLKVMGTWACVEVSDTGVGMAPETADRMFDPFFTTKARGHGTGLGLASVQAIIRQHGGALEVQSAPEEGTSVRVFLPLVAEKVPSETITP